MNIPVYYGAEYGEDCLGALTVVCSNCRDCLYHDCCGWLDEDCVPFEDDPYEDVHKHLHKVGECRQVAQKLLLPDTFIPDYDWEED